MSETAGSAKVLLVEDEKNLGSTLLERLEFEGFEVEWVMSLEQAATRIRAQAFELVLLDVGLPDGSGFQLAPILREVQPQAALIFLTAFGTPEDRIRGLELGAQDYIMKPFYLKELLLRMRNALKRAQSLKLNSESAAPTVVTIGKAKVNFLRFEAEVEGKISALTHKETALLKLLLQKRGCVVSRDEILDHAWSPDEFPTPRTVDNFILRLRRLVEWNPEHPQVIKSIRGIGYQLF
ncbi:MAG: response regulator transcription factor [Bdellovibrionia bacterium]